MSDSEGSPPGSPEEQPGSPEEQADSSEEQQGSPEEQPGSPEEQEDVTTEANGDQPEESKNAEQESGSRKRSLSTSDDKDDNSPSKKVAKEEIPLAIICDNHAKTLEKVKQTSEFRLNVKVTEDLSLATIPAAVEELLSEDPETKCVVIILPQVDLRHTSIPHACKMFNCSGKGMQHTLPVPVPSLDPYMETLKRTKDELLDTYPDTEFYWATPGPVDFRHLNRKEIEKNHSHSVTSEFMWKTIAANYIKRLKVIGEGIAGDMTMVWFTRACWLNKERRTSGTQHAMHQRLLQGDLVPVRTAGLIDEGENLSMRGSQALWKIINEKVTKYRSEQAKEKAKKEAEMEEDDSGKTEDDQNGEKVNGKAEEDTQKDKDTNESQKKRSTTRATLIGDSWLKIVSEIERWHPDNRNRINIKIYPDLTLDSVIEKVDEVLSEEQDTKNTKIFLSVFQNYIANGLSPEYVENEVFPCAFSTVEDLMEKACNINKYIKKSYPQIEVFWIAPGPVGYFNKDDQKEEENSSEQEKKGEKKEEKEKKDEEEKMEDDDDDKAENEDEGENEEKEENDEDKDTKKEKTEKKNETKEVVEEEEEKEEDPEIRKLRRACSSCNTIAMILNKRLHSRFKKQVVDWFEVFNSNRFNDIKHNPKLEGELLEGKVIKSGYLDEDYINLSEIGGNRLLNLVKTTVRPNSESEEHGSPGYNKGDRRSGGMRGGRDDRRGGRGNSRGRGSGGWKDNNVGRPMDRRPNYDNRGSGQYNNPWGQQGGGNWKGQQRRFQGQGQDMRDIINRERVGTNRRGGNWGGSGGHYVDPWARNSYSGYYGQRY